MRVYSAYHSPQQRRRKQTKLFVICCCLCLSGIIVLTVRRVTRPKDIVSPVAAIERISPTSRPTSPPRNKRNLEELIQEVITDTIPGYSIIVEDLLHPFRIELGEQDIYAAASISKLPILFTLYDELIKGTISKEQTITLTEDVRQDYGTGSMRYARNGTVYSVEKMAELMIKQSDNTAAYILARHILTPEKIQSYADSKGLTETSIAENTTTNKDMNLLLKALVTGKLFSPEITQEILGLLTDSDFEDRLPANLPKEAIIYHKIGTAIAQLHDVGIVKSPSSLYYIGVFTKGVSDEPGATEQIAEISRVVYDYMNTK